MVPDDTGKNSGIRGIRHRLLGPRAGDAPTKEEPVRNAPVAANTNLKRVVFVCIGNSCRSQIAEAFARRYGTDVMSVTSSGVAPATYISPLTKEVLAERNLSLEGHFPKPFDMTNRDRNELVINMSGDPLQLRGAQVVDWDVPDPIGYDLEFFRTIADQIEGLVMRLILELRNGPEARR
jgi:arsenate reductase (thioredoxin)